MANIRRGGSIQKRDSRKLPTTQRVRWIPTNFSRTGEPGVHVWNEGGETEEFIPWSELEAELRDNLLPYLFADPSGYRFQVGDHHGKEGWLVRVVDAKESEFCGVWFGADPDNGWGFDGLIRVGKADGPSGSRVWQVYQRCSDGTYVRLPSQFGTLEEVH